MINYDRNLMKFKGQLRKLKSFVNEMIKLIPKSQDKSYMLT